MRVIAFDEIDTIYDAWCGDEIGWGYGDSRRKVFYYRYWTSAIVAQPRLRIEPLTEKERAVHRPDLPLRLYRHRAVNWAQLAADSPEALTEKLSALGIDVAALPSVAAAAITLVVIGPNDSSPPRQEKIQAREGKPITAADLLWRAGQMFLRRDMEVDDGIGLYRMGMAGGQPSYFLWGYHNHSTWMHEEKTEARLMPEWGMRRKAVGGSYQQRLKAMKRQFPFKQWRAGEEGGLEQYSKENCAAMAAIFDQLLKRLIAMGEEASEADKLAAFKEAIEATNALNDQEMNLIETGEREQLCELCNEITRAAGLDPTKYGGGEGPASQWRDW